MRSSEIRASPKRIKMVIRCASLCEMPSAVDAVLRVGILGFSKGVLTAKMNQRWREGLGFRV